MLVKRRFRFEAAHSLPHHPGKCRDVHGHGYVLEVTVDLHVDEHSGLAIDFHEMKQIVRKEVLDQLDHKNLNDVVDNPTAEQVAVWVWRRLSGDLPGLKEIQLHETADCSVIYRGE